MNATIVPAPHDSVVSLDRVPEERVEPPFLEQRTNSSASSSASANATFESAMRVDDANRTTSVTATERWISPLAGIAASTTLHRKSESILRASHASVILLDSSRGYFGELPVSLASLSLQRRHLEPVSQSGSQPVTMLVAGDLLSFASNQEAVQ
jgi:hypothetical protein